MSKFCANCGAQLDDKAAFCKQCGAKQPETAAAPQANTAPAETSAPQTPQAPASPAAPVSDGSPIGAMGEKLAAMSAEQKKKIGIISAIAAAAVILVIVVVSVIVSLTKYQKIDCKDLVYVSYTGIDGKATASVYLATPGNIQYNDPTFDSKFKESKYYDDYDYDGFASSLASKWLLDDDDKDFKDAWTKFDSKKDIKKAQDKLEDVVEFKVDEDKLKNLKNGDTIEIKVKYKEDKLKDKNIKLENTEFTITVEGLTEAEVLDPLSKVTVSFEGADGHGTMKINTDALSEDEKELFYISCDQSYDSDLSNGGTVTVKAECYMSMSDGYLIYDKKYYTYDENAMSRDFTVEGLKELAVLDPFEGVEITYSGVAPDLDVSVNTDNCPEVVRDYIYFDIDDRYDLAIGDTFTVTASVDSWYNEDLAEQGYKLESEEVTKQFTVEETAPHYINDLSEVANIDMDVLYESLLEDINDSVDSAYLAGERVFDYDEDGKITKIKSVTLDDTYLVAPKDAANSSNKLYQFFKVETTCTVEGKSKNITFYVLDEADSAYVDGGELKYDDYWVYYYVSQKKSEMLKEYVNSDSNKEDGKVITSIKAGETPEEKPAESEPDDSSSKADDSSSKADDSSSKTDDSSSKTDDSSSQAA